ncbi:MAG TPA: parallel beta-helix domain-containing protein [Blastocatellia bacterium]|nr:parallel beta-helix domain-containing protein [Blastocatellia bacterium]
MATSAQEMELAQPRSKGRRWLKVLLALLAVLLGAFMTLGLYPVKPDFVGNEGTAGVDPNGGGLKKAYPALVVPADNPAPADDKDARVELGRLLFFDPLLSGANDVSCATCHHPDLGFSDGRRLSMGKGGKGLGAERIGGDVIRRGAPTVWNATFNHKQFWDGRADTLEDQAKGPITNEHEMNEKEEDLLKELKGIPEYVQKFDAVFNTKDGAGVTFDNVAKAIATFERTLTANNSPFDKFVAGDHGALTAAQKRGFNLFRSDKTRCFECHGMPTFANRDFKIIGVPELEGQAKDFGRFDVTNGEGNKFAFKVPTLRNVVLNAPYMHNGRFATLDEVIDFYAAGGGPGVGNPVPHLDDKMRAYNITKEEKADLIAFLLSLTDESNLPAFPDKVPSGLQVVSRVNNPAREIAKGANSGASAEERVIRQPTTITVKAGQSIQAAINTARAGDTIEVEPGIYNESLTIDLNDITFKGKTTASPFEYAKAKPDDAKAGTHTAMGWPILDGKNELADGIIATGSNFKIEGFEFRNYKANGIQVQHAHRPVFRDLLVSNSGLYGTYPVSCTGVLIERVAATRIADAAIYVGQSRDIIVKDSIAYASVTGIEIENSINSIVENNHVFDNASGILVFLLPNNVSKVGRDHKVSNNKVIANNHKNFGNPNAIVGQVPSGGGILVMAADNVEVTNNEIRDNNSYGVAVTSLEISFPKVTQFDVGPTPENVWIHTNKYANNGAKPDEKILKNGLQGKDLLWDLSGYDNRWDEKEGSRMVPLPSSPFPLFVRRGYWRVLNWYAKYLG